MKAATVIPATPPGLSPSARLGQVRDSVCYTHYVCLVIVEAFLAQSSALLLNSSVNHATIV